MVRERLETSALLFATDNWLLNMDKVLINGVLYLDVKRHLTLSIIKFCKNTGVIWRRGTVKWRRELNSVQIIFDARSHMCVVNGSTTKINFKTPPVSFVHKRSSKLFETFNARFISY